MRQLTAGSRGSKLALTQTEGIIKALGGNIPLKVIKTRGDNIQDVALAQIEGKAFFTKEIDDALLAGEIDLAVHSYKDIPTDLPDNIIIAAVPKRESPLDALVGVESIEALPLNAVIGTSSLRRQALARHLRPDLVMKDLRGNLDTRMNKQAEGQYDAIIVAEAGLRRMGYEPSKYHPLPGDDFIPASGQGALAITARKDDTEVLEFLKQLEHDPTRLACNLERHFLTMLDGGCQVPAGIYSTLDPDGEIIELKGFISSVDGKKFLTETRIGKVSDGIELAGGLAESLLRSGGEALLQELRKEDD